MVPTTHTFGANWGVRRWGRAGRCPVPVVSEIVAGPDHNEQRTNEQHNNNNNNNNNNNSRPARKADSAHRPTSKVIIIRRKGE